MSLFPRRDPGCFGRYDCEHLLGCLCNVEE